MMKKILIFAVVVFILCACMPNPKDVAEADVMRIQARQNELDAIQAREQRNKLNVIAVMDAEREQAVKDAAFEREEAMKDAALADIMVIYSRLIYWCGISLVIVSVYLIISVGKGLNVAIAGVGQAVARAAMVKANLIYLDKATGQYPLVLEYAGKGIVSLTDPNTNTTVLLNTRNEPDRLMVQSAAAVRHVGVLASAASKSKDPTGVAMVQPLIIDAEARYEH